jgi:hypothetical protein
MVFCRHWLEPIIADGVKPGTIGSRITTYALIQHVSDHDGGYMATA